jgi:hypothetical protein
VIVSGIKKNRCDVTDKSRSNEVMDVMVISQGHVFLPVIS